MGEAGHELDIDVPGGEGAWLAWLVGDTEDCMKKYRERITQGSGCDDGSDGDDGVVAGGGRTRLQCALDKMGIACPSLTVAHFP